jgi:hypothetical protein
MKKRTRSLTMSLARDEATANTIQLRRVRTERHARTASTLARTVSRGGEMMRVAPQHYVAEPDDTVHAVILVRRVDVALVRVER